MSITHPFGGSLQVWIVLRDHSPRITLLGSRFCDHQGRSMSKTAAAGDTDTFRSLINFRAKAKGLGLNPSRRPGILRNPCPAQIFRTLYHSRAASTEGISKNYFSCTAQKSVHFCTAARIDLLCPPLKGSTALGEMRRLEVAQPDSVCPCWRQWVV